jgi:hypothetical protein
MSEDDNLITVLNEINLKLSLILGELLKAKDDIVVKDTIISLYNSGLDPKNISQILNIPPPHASQEISRYKKSLKEGSGKKQEKNTKNRTMRIKTSAAKKEEKE